MLTSAGADTCTQLEYSDPEIDSGTNYQNQINKQPLNFGIPSSSHSVARAAYAASMLHLGGQDASSTETESEMSGKISYKAIIKDLLRYERVVICQLSNFNPLGPEYNKELKEGHTVRTVRTLESQLTHRR